MIIAVDIDDTLCTRLLEAEFLGSPRKYEYCLPKPEMIQKVNEAYDKGHQIVLYTSRGMTSIGTNVQEIEEKLKEVTERKLKLWGVKYHKLVFGKIHYDILVDDKTMTPSDFLSRFEL